MAAAAARLARPDRGRDRGRERLDHLVPDPGAAARHPAAAGCGCGRVTPSGWNCRSAGTCSPATPTRPPRMVELLEAAVTEMHKRAGEFGGRTRTFAVSAAFPFLVVIIDELAFLTAYQPERDLRKRAEAAIATLTSQGRSVGVCVVGALQDPRKDVINLRNLFPTRIAMRLDESDQVDMVLGDGARDRGALADQISPLPEVGAGVAYVRLETSPDPVRVRAGHVTDTDIHDMAAPGHGGR